VNNYIVILYAICFKQEENLYSLDTNIIEEMESMILKMWERIN